MLKLLRRWGMACVMAFGLAGGAQAATVAPNGASAFTFGWTDGLGPIDEIDGMPDTFWSLTLGQESLVSITVTDCCKPGDSFSLLADGLDVPWSSIGNKGAHFQAHAEALLLPATYTFSLVLDALASNEQTSRGSALFEVTPAPVPLPASMPLLGVALLGVGALRRRRAADRAV